MKLKKIWLRCKGTILFIINIVVLILLIEYGGLFGFLSFFIFAGLRIYLNYIRNKEFLDSSLQSVADDIVYRILASRAKKKRKKEKKSV